jgi:SAM-dependent methyltransferase
MRKAEAQMESEDFRLRETGRAFSRVAGYYDGPAGNNAVIQRMRAKMWQTLMATFPAGSQLLEFGCGTGIDAAYLAGHGYSVLATDWSPAMVERTRARVAESGLEQQADGRVLGIQNLDQLKGEHFDGIYSNLGPLNCVPDLRHTAQASAELLRPGGRMVVSVIGRVCPWEIAYYVAHAKWKRAFVRWGSGAVPVPLSGETVWTRYYMPRQFYKPFAASFELDFYQGLCIGAPPPYMLGVYERLERVCELGERLDDWMGALPYVRDLGDHFLMVMTKRP